MSNKNKKKKKTEEEKEKPIRGFWYGEANAIHRLLGSLTTSSCIHFNSFVDAKRRSERERDTKNVYLISIFVMFISIVNSRDILNKNTVKKKKKPSGDVHQS